MHMMSKKKNSGEMDTVRRSRAPAVVSTANRKFKTHEEAQVFVHDLNLFVIVQVLDGTPAVPSFGKLCEEHGYFYEWVSGQKPRFDQTREDNYLQNGQFRTSCCSRVVIQFWYQFVLNIDVAGHVLIRSSRSAT